MTHRPGARRAPTRWRAAAAACGIALLLSGCSVHRSAPDPWTPSAPPVTESASAGLSSDTPDPDIQATVPTASAQLYKQAEQLYTQYYTAESALESMGGAEQLPPQVASLLTGEALAKVSAIHKSAKENGFHWVDGKPAFQTAKMAQLTTDIPNGTVIAIQACEITVGAKLVKGDGTVLLDAAPVMLVHHYFMDYNEQHQLVIYNLTGGTETVASCPF